uniref:Rrf2 family transcriptional regulator n=1 Tax=Loa loa TaxID=7209 RepID=A0A1I7V639_LOALO
MIGILDSFILGKIQGRQASKTGNMQVHLRFLSALALFDLIRECPLGDVARRFHINREHYKPYNNNQQHMPVNFL